jgi:hypothetical protein
VHVIPCSKLYSFLLVLQPRAMEKLRTEITATCGDGPKTNRNDLKKMSYLQNVSKESQSSSHSRSRHGNRYDPLTLRLYPSVPVNARSALRITVLPTGGRPNGTVPVLIPKESAIACSVYSMHRRKHLYGMDAELFRPERLDEKVPLHQDSTKAKWGYLPFHGILS